MNAQDSKPNMALFDFNTYNIENFTESSGGWLKTIISIFGGFLLKAGYDEWRKSKDILETGETFEYQIQGLKLAIADQAKDIYKKLKTKDLKDKIQITLHFTDNFRIIQALKELDLVKYYSKKMGKDTASIFVHKRYNQFKVLELEIDRLKTAVNTIRENSDTLIKSYSELNSKLNQIFNEYLKQNTGTFLNSDSFFVKFRATYDQYHKDDKISMPLIMNWGNTYHQELEFPPLDDHTHVLYSELNQFRILSRVQINEFLSKLNSYEEALNIVLAAFKGIYQSLYNEELKLDEA